MNSRFMGMVLVLLSLTIVAGAQTKTSGVVKCDKPSQPQKLDIGDKPNHSLIMAQIHCTWTKPMEIAGTETKEDTVTFSNEASGMKAQGHGFVVGTLASGDKFYARTHGTDKYNKDGTVESSDGTFTFAGGTGKVRRIAGTGTFKGKPDPDGNIIYTVDAAYELPK